MCIAIPMKVIEIDGVTARVEQEGVIRTVRIDFVAGICVGACWYCNRAY